MSSKDYKIVHTDFSDLPFIYWLFEEAMKYQKSRGFPVYNGYDKEILDDDIDQNRQYKIIQNNEIICIFSICHSDKIVWRDKDLGESIYLHRIVTNPGFRGQNNMAKILTWSKKYAGQYNIQSLRMDTWADNPGLISYYKKFGFQFVEYFTTPNTLDLPIQQRGNDIILLELKI